ncbi:hypothetical protein ACOME3_007661 [Neoechinorhynchus agilis]
MGIFSLSDYDKFDVIMIVVVFVALFLDNMLLTSIVAIVPDLLYHIDLRKLGPQANISHQEWLGKENAKVGIMFASKAIVQLLFNPLVGFTINRVGYSIPLFVGLIIMSFSTLLFAHGSNYGVLFCARAIQGVGSSMSSVAGLGMLADHFQDDMKRGKSMGIALGGLAVGVLIGPPFGGFMYQFVGRKAPFYTLIVLAICNGALQLIGLKPSIKPERERGPSVWKLMLDPYILITTGALALGNVGIAMMEPLLPMWMLTTMNASEWQQGSVFLPASVTYLLSANLFGSLAFWLGRWLCCLIGLQLVAIGLLTIHTAHHIISLLVPNGIIGIAIGMVDASMMPTFAHLVDIRHSSVYANVYAIGDIAFCLGYALGPSLGGLAVRMIGFNGMLVVIAIICIIYSPLLILLRNPPVLRFDDNMAYRRLK